ncbi:MAG: CoA pyrophosphatase [Balneolaceae bacterium]
MHNFKEFLQNRLQQPLPGKIAQDIMQPMPANGRRTAISYNPNNKGIRNSSVLVPIIAWNGTMEVVLTLRTMGIRHGGQICFPGGGTEGSETIEETALREAHEEIGLIESSVKIAGSLSPLYINHSENMVRPIVGFIEKEQKFTANPNEVEEIFTVPFSELIEKKNHIRQEWKLRDVPYNVPFWDVHHVPLWGATAMMMSELMELYKEFLVSSEVNKL